MQSKEEFKSLLGNNIRRARVSKKMTVEQLALEAGLTYSQVSRIELGKINTSAYTIHLIAETLSIPPAQLFITSDDPGKKELFPKNRRNNKPN
jgi:transcriptional regulator with XRE-family HTH domain